MEISRRLLLGGAAALVAADIALPSIASARETELREPDRPIVRNKPLKISVDFQNWSVVGVPLEQRYDAAARLGFRYVSLGSDRNFRAPTATAADINRHKKLIRDAGVEVATLVVGFAHSDLDETKRKQAVDNWKKEFDLGIAMGCRRFNCELGTGWDNPKPHADAFLRSFDELVPYMEKAGVHLDVESHPNDFYEKHEDAYALIKHYNSKALGYLYAIPHTFYYDNGKGDVARMMRDCAPSLSHVIIADSRNKWVPFRYNINPTDSPARLHDHYPYKTGDINWQAVWDTLRELKFADSPDHIINVTMFGSPNTYDSDAMEYRRVIQQEIGGS